MTYSRARAVQPQRRTKKREQALEAAFDLFKRHGMKRVTMTEVAEAAGISKVTLYKYFANKEDLARAVIERISDQVVRRVDEIDGMDIPFERKIEMIVQERIDRLREWSGEFIDELLNAEPELAGIVAERVKRTAERYTQFIRKAQEEGHCRDDISPEVVLAIMDKLYQVGSDADLARRAGGYETLVRTLYDLLFYGLIARGDASG